MCKHLFSYPEDKRENYNPDSKTLTGVCKYCGVKQISYGMRWSIPLEEKFLHDIPYGKTQFEFDKSNIMC